MIAIIDYGAGNLRSVSNALVKLGYRHEITAEPEGVLGADVVIFPGVGAAGEAMRCLGESGVDEAIREVIRRGRPFFAVCVGMQVLFSSTEEGGQHECLGVLTGEVKRLPSGVKVPHMGWNQVNQRIEHPIFKGIPEGANFYFVHSYYSDPENVIGVAGTTEYGITICSALVSDNLVATQFHPEKSGGIGLRMYDNFLKRALGRRQG